jgi:DNA-binding transcriptional regulator PaaX
LNQWLLLVYRIPREPTAHRVSVWRKLKQLGAMLMHDSVWVLPATPQTREHFQWLGAEITELGGEATLLEAAMTTEQQRAELAKSFAARTDDAYKDILAQLRKKNADLATLSRRYQQVVAQDFFRSKLSAKVRQALLAKGEGKP